MGAPEEISWQPFDFPGTLGLGQEDGFLLHLPRPPSSVPHKSECSQSPRDGQRPQARAQGGQEECPQDTAQAQMHRGTARTWHNKSAGGTGVVLPGLFSRRAFYRKVPNERSLERATWGASEKGGGRRERCSERREEVSMAGTDSVQRKGY